MADMIVVGGLNMDLVVKVARMPVAGETVHGGDVHTIPGGKGANQAVCAAKLGAQVKLVARVGDDVFGETSLANFRSVGVDTEFVTRDPDHPSGVALIAVDAKGENAIVVAPGANLALTPVDVDRAADAIRAADAVVLQLEIPAETVEHTIDLARSMGTRVVLNPAPIRPIRKETLGKVEVLVPNQHEAAELIGASSGAELDAESAARRLRELGVPSVVITLGSRGAFVAAEAGEALVEAFKVNAVDTTAAGDAFTASLACGIAEGMPIIEAARFAAKVAAISATRMGAQPSMPSREEVEGYRFGN